MDLGIPNAQGYSTASPDFASSTVGSSGDGASIIFSGAGTSSASVKVYANANAQGTSSAVFGWLSDASGEAANHVLFSAGGAGSAGFGVSPPNKGGANSFIDIWSQAYPVQAIVPIKFTAVGGSFEISIALNGKPKFAFEASASGDMKVLLSSAHILFSGAASGSMSLRALRSAYGAEVVRDIPVGWWRLGEASGTAMQDESTQARHGTYTNAPTLGSAGAVYADPDTSVTFNGTTQYAGTITFALTTTSGLTVEVAVYPIAATGIIQRILHKPSVFALYLGTDMIPVVEYNVAGGSPFSLIPTTPLPFNKWSYVMFSHDGVTAKLYVNGDLVGQNSDVGPPSGVVSPVNVGRLPLPSSQFFNGRIDEASIYQAALSHTRVKAHYYAAAGKVPVSMSVKAEGSMAIKLVTRLPISLSFTGSGICSIRLNTVRIIMAANATAAMKAELTLPAPPPIDLALEQGLDAPLVEEAVVVAASVAANYPLRRGVGYAEVAAPTLRPGWAHDGRVQRMETLLNRGVTAGETEKVTHVSVCRMPDMRQAMVTAYVRNSDRQSRPVYSVEVRVQTGAEAFGQPVEIVRGAREPVLGVQVLSPHDPLQGGGCPNQRERALVALVWRVSGPDTTIAELYSSLDRGQNWRKVWTNTPTVAEPRIASNETGRLFLFFRNLSTHALDWRWTDKPIEDWPQGFAWDAAGVVAGVDLLAAPVHKQFGVSRSGGFWNVVVADVVRSANPSQTPDTLRLQAGYSAAVVPTTLTRNGTHTQPLTLGTTNAIEWAEIGRVGRYNEFGGMKSGDRTIVYGLRTSGTSRVKQAQVWCAVDPFEWRNVNKGVPRNGSQWGVNEMDSAGNAVWEERWTQGALADKSKWLSVTTPSTIVQYRNDSLLGPSVFVDSKGDLIDPTADNDPDNRRHDIVDTFASFWTRSNAQGNVAFPPYEEGRPLTIEFSLRAYQYRTWYHNIWLQIDDPRRPDTPIFRADYYVGQNTPGFPNTGLHPHDHSRGLRISFCKRILLDVPVLNQRERLATSQVFYSHPLPWMFQGFRLARWNHRYENPNVDMLFRFRISYVPTTDTFTLYWQCPFHGGQWEPFTPYELALADGPHMRISHVELPNNRIHVSDHGFEYRANQAIRFTTTGTLPAPLTTTNVYYSQQEVIGVSFKVSLTPGGIVEDITTYGTGVHRVYTVNPNTQDKREYVDVGGAGQSPPDPRDLYIPHATEKYWEQPRNGLWPARFFIGQPETKPAFERQSGLNFGALKVARPSGFESILPQGRGSFVPRMSGSWDFFYAGDASPAEVRRSTYGHPWQDVTSLKGYNLKWAAESGPDQATLEFMDADNTTHGPIYGTGDVQGWHVMAWAKAGWRDRLLPRYDSVGEWEPWVCPFFGTADTGRARDEGDGPVIRMEAFSPMRQIARTFKTQGFTTLPKPEPTVDEENGDERESTEQKVREYQIIYQRDKLYPNDPNLPVDDKGRIMHWEDYPARFAWEDMLGLPREKLDLPVSRVTLPHFTINEAGGDNDIMADIMERLWKELGYTWYYDFFAGGVLRASVRPSEEAPDLTLPARTTVSLPLQVDESDWGRAGNVVATATNLQSRPNHVVARVAAWPDGAGTVQVSHSIYSGLPSQGAIGEMTKKDTAIKDLEGEWQGARVFRMPLHCYPYVKPLQQVEIVMNSDIPDTLKTRYERVAKVWLVKEVNTVLDTTGLVTNLTMERVEPLEGV